ncbi:MAG: hypothetical protein EAZ61_03050 [Oscillatoriales cyanobacterium]|nr:MAG: hypothetical protein EAZ61_03050 [Oscillatoriales cyanobacterium]
MVPIIALTLLFGLTTMPHVSRLSAFAASLLLSTTSALLSGVVLRPVLAETDPPNPGGPRPIYDATAPYIIAPRNSELLDQTPRFQWTRVQNVASYVVSLESADRGVFWQTEVEGTEVVFDGAPLAADTDYTLKVKARSQETGRTDNTEVTTFYIIPEAERTAIEAELQRLETTLDLNDRGTLLESQVRLLSEEGLIGDAINLLDLELVNNPDSLDAVCLLRDLFEQTKDPTLKALGIPEQLDQYRIDRNLGSCEVTETSETEI